jgi:glucose/arabinose dehydrogenase
MKLKMLSLAAILLVQGVNAKTPSDAPPPPPPWKQGMSQEQTTSPLHPFAPNLTGVEAKDLPINTLKVPDGFKVEVWLDGVPNARSLVMSPSGTVYVSNRIGKNVYAIVEKDGKRTS